MMGEILEIKRKDGAILQGQFKLLEEKDIKDIMRLQKIVIDALDDRFYQGLDTHVYMSFCLTITQR